MADVSGKLDTLKPSLDSSLVDAVDLRLQGLGYTIQDSDAWMVGFAMQKVENSIKTECNVSVFPEELKQIEVDMVCGEFLFTKKGSGQLQGFDLDFDPAIKQIQEGDTNVVYAVGEGNPSDEQRLNSLIALLMNSGKGQLVSFRRLKW